MKREAFKMYLKPGCEAEYEKDMLPSGRTESTAFTEWSVGLFDLLG